MRNHLKQSSQFDGFLHGGLGWLGLSDSSSGLVCHFGALASTPYPNGIGTVFFLHTFRRENGVRIDFAIHFRPSSFP